MQQQGDGFTGTQVISHLQQQAAHRVQRHRLRPTFKAGQSQASAAVFGLQRIHRAIPQGQRIGPAVQHEDEFVAAASYLDGCVLDVDGHAASLRQ